MTRPPLIIPPPGPSDAAAVVRAALERSFTRAQLSRSGDGVVVVAVDPGDDVLPLLRRAAGRGGKAVVFGRPGPAVADWLGLSVSELGPDQRQWDAAVPWGESPIRLRYAPHPLWRPPVAERPLWRFDFTDEWNNLGYGRIRADGGPFSLAVLARAGGGTQVLADIAGTPWCYAALGDRPDHSVLWIGRSVGPVDGPDWRLVERFIADWRPDDLACLPCLEDVPFGFDAVVTMRLDCDQDVSSARPLADLYRDHGIPFSLAVLTGLEMDAEDLALLDEVGRDGAVLSHSVSHPVDWGGSRAAARREAAEARLWLERRLGIEVPYAVSPFHQNSRKAVAGLAEAGLTGFIGGIVHNDPEFLMARSGVVPFESGLVSQSHQCMLHGDCIHHAGRGLEVYRRALESALAGRGLLGYLDHPQSATYQYGWTDIEEQVTTHQEWLDILARHHLWRPDPRRALDFTLRRSRSALRTDGGRVVLDAPPAGDGPPLAVSWRGGLHAA